jgi:hypothetical protein
MDDEQLKRIFAKWTALAQAIITATRRKPFVECKPWESPQKQVQVAWDNLTHPDNLADLEAWYARGEHGREMNDFARETTLKAIEVCKARRDAGSA